MNAVSVIIPTYNRAHLIERAVGSVLRAISPGDEVLVIDDGSEDGTGTVLERYADAIRYHRVPHGGAGIARNRGIRLAKNDWIAFLDSDDEWMPDHLSLHRSFLANSNVLFSFSNFDLHRDQSKKPAFERMRLVSWTRDTRNWKEILGDGRPFSEFAELPRGRGDFMVHEGNLYEVMINAPYVPAWTSLVKRDAAGASFRFAEDLPTFEDWECFARMSKGGNAAYLDCSTAINHGHEGPRLTNANSLVQASTRITMMERVWGKDTEFLENHGEAYRKVLMEQKSIRIKQLIAQGDTAAARNELSGSGDVPHFVKWLSLLPGWAAKTGYRIYRSIR